MREALETHDEPYVSTWLLAYENEKEDTTTLAAGAALIDLARSALA